MVARAQSFDASTQRRESLKSVRISDMSRSEIAGRRLAAAFASAALSFLVLAASPLADSTQPEQWTLERTLTIGSAFDPETGLTRVGDALVVGDRLFVTQPLEQRLRVFSLTGDFLGFIGRAGEGPGEFRSVDLVGLHDGRAWVYDSSLGRFQYFDAEGRFVSSRRLMGHPTLRVGGVSVWGVLAAGASLVREVSWADQFAKSPEKPQHVVRVDPDGLPPDTVAVIVGRTSIVAVQGTGWVKYSNTPESYRSLLSVVPDGSGFVVVHRTAAASADPHTFRVVRFDARADTAWAREIPYHPVRVSREWRSRHVEQHVAGFEMLPGMTEGSVRRVYERAYGNLRFFPPVRDVHAGADGTTWVLLRTGVESFEWEVLDAAGRSLARVRSPPQGRIMWADAESLWFEELDELDVPYLVRYAIRRP